MRLFSHLFQFIFPPVSVNFYTCLSLFLHVSEFSLSTFLGRQINIFGLIFRLFERRKKIFSGRRIDFLREEKPTCPAKKPTGKGEKKTTCDYELNGLTVKNCGVG